MRKNKEKVRRAMVTAMSAGFALGAVPIASGVTWTGGGASASWSDAANFDAALGGGSDLEIGSGFASGTVMSLDGNRTIDTLQFTAGSDGVNLVINPGSGGFLLPQNRGDGVNASIQMNSSSHHTINAQVQYAGNTGQESRYVGSGGGIVTFAGGVNAISNGKLEIKGTNNTVFEFASAFTGSSTITVFGSAILRTGDNSHLTTGSLSLSGILELTGNVGLDSRGIGAGAGNIQFNNNGGFAAVGQDVTLNVGGAGGAFGVNDYRLGSVHATHTLTLENGLQRSNQAVRIASINGSAEIEAILNGELGRSDVVDFRGDGTLQINSKISSRDPIEVNSGTILLAASAQTANNGGTVQAGKTILLNSDNTIAGDAALLLTGAQARGNAFTLQSAGGGLGTLGGYSADAVSFTGNVTLQQDSNLYARLGTTQADFAGNISGAFGLSINDAFADRGQGQGVVLFSSNKAYTGATEVIDGTLVIGAGVNSLGTSGITVRSGAALQVDGAISQAVVVDVGGIFMGTGSVGSAQISGEVAAGNSVGTLSVLGQTDFFDQASFELEIQDIGLTPGAGWDFLDVSGPLLLPNGGEIFIDLLALDPSVIGQAFSIEFASSLGGVQNFAGTTFTVRDPEGDFNGVGTVSLSQNTLFLNFTPRQANNVAIPEPASVLLLTLAAGAALRRSRRECD